MAVAFVKAASGMQWSGTGFNLGAFSGGVTAGDCIVVFIGVNSTSATIGVTDSLGNTYTAAGSKATGGLLGCQAFVAKNITGGACTVSITISSSAFATAIAHEVSGVDTTTPVNAYAAQVLVDPGTGTDAATSGSATTTVAGCYIFGGGYNGSGGTINAGTNFTSRDTETAARSEDLTQGSAGSIAATFTLGGAFDDSAVCMVALQPPQAGGEPIEATSSDGLVFGDTPSVRALWHLATTDGAKFGDIPAAGWYLVAAAADGTVFGDTTTGLPRFQAIASDGIALGDTPTGLLRLIAAAIDGAVLGDTPSTIATWHLTTADGIKLGDTAIAGWLLTAAASDGFKLGDTSTSLIKWPLLVTDGLKLGDTPTTIITLEAAVADGLITSDTATTIAQWMLKATDGLKLGDTPTGVNVSNIATGVVTVTWTSAGPAIVIIVSQPTIESSSAKPDIAAEGSGPSISGS